LSSAPLLLLLLVVVVLVLRKRAETPAGGPAAYYPPGYGNPGVGPGALTDPNTGATGQPSTRTQIEVGVGSAVGAGAGLYVCAGNPACAAAGAYLGGIAAPAVSHGAEAGAKGIAKGAKAAWDWIF
jgi:hypothetical protein